MNGTVLLTLLGLSITDVIAFDTSLAIGLASSGYPSTPRSHSKKWLSRVENEHSVWVEIEFSTDLVAVGLDQCCSRLLARLRGMVWIVTLHPIVFTNFAMSLTFKERFVFSE